MEYTKVISLVTLRSCFGGLRCISVSLAKLSVNSIFPPCIYIYIYTHTHTHIYIYIHVITRTILREALQLGSYSLHNVLHHAVTSSLSDQLTSVGFNKFTWKSGSSPSLGISLKSPPKHSCPSSSSSSPWECSRFLAEYQLGFRHPRPVRLPSCSPYKSITPLARTTWEKIKLAPLLPLAAFLPGATHNPCQFLLRSMYVPVRKKLARKWISSFKTPGSVCISNRLHYLRWLAVKPDCK
jgi:hypothetical protein